MNIQLHHIGVAVGDVEATIEALVAAFAAERVPAPGTGHELIRIGDIQLALVPLGDRDPRQRAWGDHVALAVPASSRADTVKRLEDHGWRSQDVRGRIYVQSPCGLLTLELLAA